MTTPIPDHTLRGGLGLVLMSAATLWAAQAMAFECPTPQPLSHPGILRETSAQTRQLEAVLADGDASNHIPIIIDDLRRRYPAVQNAEIRNYLITAYCPAVAQLSGLNDATKRARISQFVTDIDHVMQAGTMTDGSSPKNG